jgi:hypothetical protein
VTVSFKVWLVPRGTLSLELVKSLCNFGPATFANHDWKVNARLTTIGTSWLKVITTRDIRVGEEITVGYGKECFEEENFEEGIPDVFVRRAKTFVKMAGGRMIKLD